MVTILDNYTRATILQSRLNELVESNKVKCAEKQSYFDEFADAIKKLEQAVEDYNTLSSAGNLLNKIADGRVKKAIDFIATAVNDALLKVFKDDFKQIKVEISSHMDAYPQLNFVLQNPDGMKRNLKTQEGDGLGQIISLLATMCLLYISGGRRFMLLDEVLNGLHPNALELIDEILTVFEDRLGFQFLMINHGYTPNRGVIYHLGKQNDTTFCRDVELIGYDENEEVIIETMESEGFIGADDE